MLDRIDQTLSTLPRTWFLTLLLIIVGILGVFDFVTGYRLSFAVFYFVPIVLATWYVGKHEGVAVAYLSFSLSVGAGLVNARGSLESQLSVLWNGLTPLALFLVIVSLLAKLHARLELEQRLARTDHLTGCLNTHAFMPMLQYHLDLAARDHQPITLAYLDLDDFKSINDTYGHSEGDRVLKIVSKIWLESSRRIDLVARLGGDEFCILFPNTDQHGAEQIIAKARKLLSATLLTERTNVTCSIGAVTFPASARDINVAVKAADMLMYEAKSRGKNSTVFSIFEAGQDASGMIETPASKRRPEPTAADL